MENYGTSEQFRQIAELRGDTVFIIDCASLRLTYVSPSVKSLFGFSAEDISGHLDGSRTDPALEEVCGGLAERLQRFEAGDFSRLKLVREFDQPRRDGGLVPIEVISLLALDGAGRPATVVGSVRDITSVRERALQQKRFASMLNHEFRTPLSTIDGAVQRLEATGTNADEPTRARYRKIQVAVDRLINMLDEYLSPDRMEGVGRKRPVAAAEPAVLLHEAALAPRAMGRTVNVDPGNLPPTVRCEPDGLRLALKVLVDNALAYTPSNTPLSLSGRRADNGIELVVADQGPGIEADEQPKIFDKFFRGRASVGRAGSGLGLYMARSVVEVHGGSISMQNGAQCGASFRIWLPLVGEAGNILASTR